MQMFALKKRELLEAYPESDPSVDIYALNIQACINLSVEAMQAIGANSLESLAKPAKLALDCLNIASCLAPKWLPTLLYDQLIGEWTPYTKLDLQRAINLLDRYSMAEKVAEKIEGEVILGIVLHEMTQTAVWAGFNFDRQFDLIVRAMDALSKLYYQDTMQQTPQTQHIWERGLVHADKILQYEDELAIKLVQSEQQNKYKAWLEPLESFCVWVSDRSRSMGKYRESIGFADKATKINYALYGERHTKTAASIDNLGTSWIGMGVAMKAVQYHEKALEIVRQLHGEGAVRSDIAGILNNLGIAWHALKDRQRATLYHEQALEMYQKIPEEDSANTNIASALNNLGTTYSALGDKKKALQYYEQALVILQKIYGKDAEKKNIAALLHNLGSMWSDLGDKVKAMDYHEQALTMMHRIYGKNAVNAVIATVLGHIGSTCSAFGDKTKAVEYYEEALTMFRLGYGEDAAHTGIADILLNLGNALSDLGEKRKAITYFEQALAMMSQIYGNGVVNVDIANILNSLGAAWSGLGKKSRAIVFHEQALAMKRQVYGIDNVDVANTLYNIAILKGELGSFLEALLICQYVATICAKSLPMEHPQQRLIQALWQPLIHGITLTQSLDRAIMLKDWKEVNSSYAALLQLSPSCVSYHHNFACFLHVRACEKAQAGLFEEAKELTKQGDTHFKMAIELEDRVSTQVEYAQFLYLNQRQDEAQHYLNAAIIYKSGDSNLGYGTTEINTIIPTLQNAVGKAMSIGLANGEIILNPVILGYALLIIIHVEQQTTKQPTSVSASIANTYLQQMQTEVNRHPSPVHYALLAGACEQLGKPEQARAYEQLAERLWAARRPINDARAQILKSNFASGAAMAALERTQSAWRDRIAENRVAEASSSLG